MRIRTEPLANYGSFAETDGGLSFMHQKGYAWSWPIYRIPQIELNKTELP
jgi:hypothetical protein